MYRLSPLFKCYWLVKSILVLTRLAPKTNVHLWALVNSDTASHQLAHWISLGMRLPTDEFTTRVTPNQIWLLVWNMLYFSMYWK